MLHVGKKHMQEIFSEAQHTLTSHERLQKKLKHLYDQTPQNAFLTAFTRCLQVALIHGDKHRTVENTLNFASKFIASLIPNKPGDTNDEDETEELCDFVVQIFKFLFENHNSECQAIRFRVCQFINKILNALGNEACMDDVLCDHISECMMERLQDKAPAVRMQAVLALHRLQDPYDPECDVMKALMFHMSTDPSVDVRRAVITNIAINQQSLKCILERSHDCKDTVRRAAYMTLSKISVQRLSIKQRVRLLTDGLKDRSALVRDCVSKIVLPSWLRFYKGSYLTLLLALDCENSTDISTLALQSLFQSESIKVVLDELTKLLNDDKVIPVKDLSAENVLYWRVLVEYLDAHPEIANDCPVDEPLPELLPELSTFCNYVKQYFNTKSEEEMEHWEKLQHQYLLIQLMELCNSFDFADEMGRSNLRSLCTYLLTSNGASEDVVPVVVKLLIKIIPNIEERLQALAEVISEVREPMTEQEPESAAGPTSGLSAEEKVQRELKQASIRVKINELQEEQDEAIRKQDFLQAQQLKEKCEVLKNELKSIAEAVQAPPPQAGPEVRDAVKDEKALRKCPRIVREMVQSDTVKSLSATLLSLMQNFVLPCLQEDNSPIIRRKALEALGIFCLLDKELARENFFMFCFQIANDEVCEVALKVTFDLLHLYGLETFEITEENGEAPTKKKSKKKKKNLFVTDMYDEEFDTEEDESQENLTHTSSGSSGNRSNLILMLTSLLDSTSTSMRNIATEGLCKLLMACRITSSALISRLILMWYSPVTEGEENLRQLLGVFLTMYASECPRGQETLEQAFLPTLRTLMQAPVTSPLSQIDQDSVTRLFIGITRPGMNKAKASHIHNNMAISLCNAIMDSDDTTNVGVLLRGLVSLELSLDDPVYRDQLQTLIKALNEVFKLTKEKQFQRYLDKISSLIETAAEGVSMRTTEVENTAATSQLEATGVSTNITAHASESTNIHDLESDVTDTRGESENPKVCSPRGKRRVLEDPQKVVKETNLPGTKSTSPSLTKEMQDEPDPERSPDSSKFPSSGQSSIPMKESEGDSASHKRPKHQKKHSKKHAKSASLQQSTASTEASEEDSASRGRQKRQKKDSAKSSQIQTDISPGKSSNPSLVSASSPRRALRGRNSDVSELSIPARKKKDAGKPGRSSSSDLSPIPMTVNNDEPALRGRQKLQKKNTEKSAQTQTEKGTGENSSQSVVSPSPPRRSLRGSSSGIAESIPAKKKRSVEMPIAKSSDVPKTTGADQGPNNSPAARRGQNLRDLQKSVKEVGRVSTNSTITPTRMVTRRSFSQTESEGSPKLGKSLSSEKSPLLSKTSDDDSPISAAQMMQKLKKKAVEHSPQTGIQNSADESLSEVEIPPSPPRRPQRGQRNEVIHINHVTRQKRAAEALLSTSSDQESNVSSPGDRRIGRQRNVKGINKLPTKSVGTPPRKLTRRSTSQDSSEGTLKPSSSSLSDLSTPTKKTSGDNSPISATRMRQMLLKKAAENTLQRKSLNSPAKTSSESQVSPLPSRSRNMRESTSTESPTPVRKKRVADVLMTSSSEAVDSDSPQKTSRNKSNTSSPTQPRKNPNSKASTKDSAAPLSTRRSTRSQTGTPPSRTRSGKVKV